ncbi:MAG: PilW family protein [Colwellia sp.]
MNRREVKRPYATKSRAAISGFTLVELMIALVIGLLLFAGVMSVFVGMRTTTAETSNYGELQENGRFAISVLTDDLLRQNFWGDLSGSISKSNLISIPNAPDDDCVGEGVNNATFPQEVGPFRTLWGQSIEAEADEDELNPLGCFNAVAKTRTRTRSDVIQLKRVLANPLAATVEGNYYLTANLATGGVFVHGGTVPVIANARLWQYQHHVYYVRERKVGDDYIPVLMQGKLTNKKMVFSPIIDGIEQIRFMYGVDTDTNPESAGYGIVNAYISTENMTEELWDNAGGSRILAVKIFVLAKGATPDYKYTNTNTYQLGDVIYKPDLDDHYRRLLFSSTVTLYNNSVESW